MNVEIRPHITGLAMHIAGLDEQPDGGALLAIDLDVGKRRNAGKFDSGGRHEPPSDSNRLDSLVEGAGADRLNLGRSLLTNNASERAGD